MKVYRKVCTLDIMSKYNSWRRVRDSVTDNFSDEKFQRPRLAVFALYFVQTHTRLRLSNPDQSQAVGFDNV